MGRKGDKAGKGGRGETFDIQGDIPVYVSAKAEKTGKSNLKRFKGIKGASGVRTLAGGKKGVGDKVLKSAAISEVLRVIEKSRGAGKGEKGSLGGSKTSKPEKTRNKAVSDVSLSGEGEGRGKGRSAVRGKEKGAVAGKRALAGKGSPEGKKALKAVKGIKDKGINKGSDKDKVKKVKKLRRLSAKAKTKGKTKVGDKKGGKKNKERKGTTRRSSRTGVPPIGGKGVTLASSGGRSRGLQRVREILFKYYGYGKKKKYFKTRAELLSQAKVLWQVIKKEHRGRVTVKLVRALLFKGRLVEPPVLPESWYNPMEYYDVDNNIIDALPSVDPRVYVIAPKILGFNQEPGKDLGKAIALRGGITYSYETTFAPFVNYMNHYNSPIRVSPVPYAVCIQSIKLRSDGYWQVRFMACDLNTGQRVKHTWDFEPRHERPSVRFGDENVVRYIVDEDARSLENDACLSGQPPPAIMPGKPVKARPGDIAKRPIEPSPKKEEIPAVPEAVLVKKEEETGKTERLRLKISSLEKMLEKGLITPDQYFAQLEKYT